MIRAASVHLAPASSYPRFAPRRTREIVPLLTAMPTSARGEEIASRVLDRLETEVVVLDAKGTIVFCNEAARRLLAANAGVFTHRGALHFTDFENNRWLQSQFVTAPQASECKRMTFIFNADQRKRSHCFVEYSLRRTHGTIEFCPDILAGNQLSGRGRRAPVIEPFRPDTGRKASGAISKGRRASDGRGKSVRRIVPHRAQSAAVRLREGGGPASGGTYASDVGRRLTSRTRPNLSSVLQSTCGIRWRREKSYCGTNFRWWAVLGLNQ